MFFHTHIIRRYKVTSKRRSCLFANQSSNWQFLPATNLDTSFFPRKSETPNLQKSEVWSVVCHDYLPFTKVQKLWSRVTSVKRCSRPCSNAVRHGCSGDGCDVTLVLGKKWSLGIYIYIYILCICSIYDIWYQYDIYIYTDYEYYVNIYMNVYDMNVCAVFFTSSADPWTWFSLHFSRGELNSSESTSPSIVSLTSKRSENKVKNEQPLMRVFPPQWRITIFRMIILFAVKSQGIFYLAGAMLGSSAYSRNPHKRKGSPFTSANLPSECLSRSGFT